jgi:hypothetical protein
MRSEHLVMRVSEFYDSDVILYIGPIEPPFDDKFIAMCKDFRHRPNALLLLATHGGDGNAAFRIARCLQEQYETVDSRVPDSPTTAKGVFRVFVGARCKSAGTIIALGANRLLFSDYGEIGPIDVQLKDPLGEPSSGLTPMLAMDSLQHLASKHFEDCFKSLRASEDSDFSTALASEIAIKMTLGLFGTVYSQINPMRLGEFDRATKVAAEYGTRLGKGNLKEGALKKLLGGYPSHEFVIDKKEAAELFQFIEEPTEDLLALGEATRIRWNDEYLTAKSPLILYLAIDDILRMEQDNAEHTPDKSGQHEKVADHATRSIEG